MTRPFAVALWLSCWVLLASCSKDNSGPPPTTLEPPPGTGQETVAMEGMWIVEEVTVLNEVVFPVGPSGPRYEPFGLVPPQVGDEIVIDGQGFVSGGGRSLLRQECERNGVAAEYVNQFSGTFAVYRMNCQAPANPHVADGGGLDVEMAFGSTGEGDLLGLIRIQVATSFPARGLPVSGLYRVKMVRQP